MHLRVYLSRPGIIAAVGFSAWPLLTYGLVTFTGINGCVQGRGLIGFIAQHIAMLREVSSCPPGMVGMTPSLHAAMGFLTAAAFVSVFIWMLIAFVGGQAAQWVHRIAEAIARLVKPSIRSTFSAVVPASTIVFAANVVSGSQVHPGAPRRRGPPGGTLPEPLPTH